MSLSVDFLLVEGGLRDLEVFFTIPLRVDVGFVSVSPMGSSITASSLDENIVDGLGRGEVDKVDSAHSDMEVEPIESPGMDAGARNSGRLASRDASRSPGVVQSDDSGSEIPASSTSLSLSSRSPRASMITLASAAALAFSLSTLCSGVSPGSCPDRLRRMISLRF